jgi:hypothetical protein
MPDPRKFDIAISFCTEDMGFAHDLYEALCQTHEVFFFPRNSEVTTATSGNTSMYDVFKKDSKLNVVVYRPRWGQAGFTVPERDALIDRRLAEPHSYPFFIMSRPDYPAPPGFPSHLVRCNKWLFSLDEIVKQIEARLADLGEAPASVGMADLARRRVEQREFAQKRQMLLQTSNGFDAVKAYMGKMIEDLCRLRQKYTATDPKQVIRMDGTTGAYSITDNRIGLGIKWLRDGGPSISHDKLEVTEYLNRLQLPGEGLTIYFGNPTNEPQRGRVTSYKAEIGPGLHFGWVLSGSFLTHDRLADTLFQQFLALSENWSQS